MSRPGEHQTRTHPTDKLRWLEQQLAPSCAMTIRTRKTIDRPTGGATGGEIWAESRFSASLVGRASIPSGLVRPSCSSIRLTGKQSARVALFTCRPVSHSNSTSYISNNNNHDPTTARRQAHCLSPLAQAATMERKSMDDITCHTTALRAGTHFKY